MTKYTWSRAATKFLIFLACALPALSSTAVYTSVAAFSSATGATATATFDDVSAGTVGPFTSGGVGFSQGQVNNSVVGFPDSAWFFGQGSSPNFLLVGTASAPLVITFPAGATSFGFLFTCFACDSLTNNAGIRWTLLSASQTVVGSGTTVFNFGSGTVAPPNFLGISSTVPFASVQIQRMDQSTGAPSGGSWFIDTVSAVPEPNSGLSLIGSMPHLAAQENWTTTFTLVNKDITSAQMRLNFFGDPGDPLTLPLVFSQQSPPSGPVLAASVNQTLSANASLIIQTAGPQTPPVLVGSAQLAATASVDGFAIVHSLLTAQEAVVPLETRNASSYLLAFDNTGGVVAGVLLQNVSALAASIPVVIRDDTGAQISTGTIPLGSSGHTSFVLSDQFPVTAGKRGTVEFVTPPSGQISVLGLRFTNNALTAIPALANVGTSGGSIAHLASGGGWQTTFVLVNTGTSAAQTTLSFFADQTGIPLVLPLSFPQSVGGNATTASSVTQAIPAGATLVIVSNGALNLPLNGSAQLSTNGNVSGFAIVRYNLNAQEFVVPLESRSAGGYLLAFDNTNGAATGVVVNSVSAQMVNISVTVRDDTGAPIATDTLSLAANGHLAFTLAIDKYPATANIRGTIELDTPVGGHIGALALRIPISHTLSSLPALAIAAPHLTSVTPNTVSAKSSATSITITGLQFGNNAIVSFTPPGVAPVKITPSQILAAQIAATIPAALLTSAGTAQIAVQNGTGTLSNSLPFTITQQVPVLTWPNPADIQFGSALGSGQLNATASVPGTFVYSPPAGTVLRVGNGQNLSTTFTPTDTLNYTGATATASINVQPAPTPPAAPPQLVITRWLIRSGNQITVIVTISNTGGSPATNVRLTIAKIGSTATNSFLPQPIGTIGPGGANGTGFTFLNAGSSGAVTTITLGGTYDGGSFSSTARVTLP